MKINERFFPEPGLVREWSAGLRPGVFGKSIPTGRVGDRRSGQTNDPYEY